MKNYPEEIILIVLSFAFGFTFEPWQLFVPLFASTMLILILTMDFITCGKFMARYAISTLDEIEPAMLINKENITIYEKANNEGHRNILRVCLTRRNHQLFSECARQDFRQKSYYEKFNAEDGNSGAGHNRRNVITRYCKDSPRYIKIGETI